MVVADVINAADNKIGRRLFVWCPGCDDVHAPAVVGDEGDLPEGPVWSWDRNLTAPTITPSIRVHYQKGDCHSFITAGRWQFLEDSWHSLAGQTVPMVPVPDWLVPK